MEQILHHNKMWDKIAQISARIESVNKFLDSVEEIVLSIEDQTNFATKVEVEELFVDLTNQYK
jgi:hypothetical protein